MKVNTLQDMLERDEPVTILDVRLTGEFEEWAIPGSTHLNAYQALKAKDPEAMAGLSLPTDRPVVIV
jgi:rhodanese-related sulfurtransferase